MISRQIKQTKTSEWVTYHQQFSLFLGHRSIISGQQPKPFQIDRSAVFIAVKTILEWFGHLFS
jgi:hypothetical protein